MVAQDVSGHDGHPCLAVQPTTSTNVTRSSVNDASCARAVGVKSALFAFSDRDTRPGMAVALLLHIVAKLTTS